MPNVWKNLGLRIYLVKIHFILNDIMINFDVVFDCLAAPSLRTVLNTTYYFDTTFSELFLQRPL